MTDACCHAEVKHLLMRDKIDACHSEERCGLAPKGRHMTSPGREPGVGSVSPLTLTPIPSPALRERGAEGGVRAG